MAGTVQKRTWADGRKPRYIARIRLNGKERSKSCDTKKQAEDWLNEIQGLKPTGKRTDNQMLGPIAKAWAEQTDAKSTRIGRVHLHDNLGPLAYKKLGDVDVDMVREWRQVLVTGRPWADNKPLSSSTVSTLTRHLSAIFNDAVAKGQIARNPVSGSRKGKGKMDSRAAVDPSKLIRPEEVRAMIANAGEPYKTMLWLFAHSGIRPGEMGGLRVRSVDLSRQEMYVVEQVNGEYGEWDWTTPKTIGSKRTIPLAPEVCEILDRHLDAHRDYPLGSPLFRTERDYQWTTPNIGKTWRDIAKKAKVEGHSPKSMRHFYASALIRAGQPVNVVQARLGHASPSVTLGIYTHLWGDNADETRKAISGIL